MSRININGTDYEVLNRKPVTMHPIVAELSLRKQGGTHVYSAWEMASGAYSDVTDTKFRRNGSRAR